jgi:hypothetical protein
MNLPDLIVNDISLKDCNGNKIKFDKNYDVFFVTSGQPFTITVEIENIGSASASGAFNIYLRIDDLYTIFYKTDLKANKKASFSHIHYSFYYPLNSPNSFSIPYSTHSISAEVDTGKAILESNEGNNLMTNSIKIVKAEWTIFLYMSSGYAGGSNSDLSNTVECELGVLSLVGSDPKMSIIAMAGITGKSTKIYFITKDAKIEIPGGNLNLSWSSTDIEMGSYWNLICFGNYAMRQFEAKHYIVSLCDHGGGPRDGLVWGTMNCSKRIYPNEVHTALSQFYGLNKLINSKKIDLVILEACLMSSIEVAYEIKDYADFMSAPELNGISINNGVVLHYDLFLGWLKDHYNSPDVTRDLCKQIVDTYIKYFPLTMIGQIVGHSVQWGAIDLSKIGSLATNLDSLVNSLISGCPGYRSKITDMFNNTLEFYGRQLFDIRDLMRQIKANFDDLTIKQLAQNVENALSIAVVYTNYFIPHLSFDHYDNTNGLSIYFNPVANMNLTNWKEPCKDYYDVTNWDEFLLVVYDRTSPDMCTINAIPPGGWSSTFNFRWNATDPWPKGVWINTFPSGIAWYGWNIDNGIETWTKSTTLVVPSSATQGLSDGWHTLFVRAKDLANNIGPYGSCIFKLDTTRPSNPNNYASTPPRNVWTNDNTISINWFGASDDPTGSGVVDGYSFVWDQISSTIPDTTADTTGTSTVSFALSSGNWYFHVRSRDNAKNWAIGAFTVGPYKIDVTAPTAPGAPTFSSSDVPDGIFTLSWPPSTDTLSGVSKYELQQMASGGSWITVDGNIAGSLNSFTVSVSPGTYYFRVRAIDVAGNVGSYSATSAAAIVPAYHWFGMTIDDGHFFNFYSFQDSFNGTAYHIDTIGSGDWAYQFMGTYTEEFVVRSDGTIGVSGWFRFSDLGFQPPGGYPLEGRREVLLYLIIMDPVSNTIEETALVLDYTDPVDEWIWVDNLVVSDLTPESTINIGIGRSDAWEIDWWLTAEWAGVVVTDANGPHIT